MSDKQSEDYHQRKQNISGRKTVEDHNRRRKNVGIGKERTISKKSHVKASEEQQDMEGDQYPWYVRKEIIDDYLGEQQEQEEPEDPWPARSNILEEDIEDQQDYTQNWAHDQAKISEEYLEEPQEDKHSEAAGQHSRLASHFKFMRQFGNQYQEVVAAAEKVPSQQASHPSFMDQLWSRYKGIAAAEKAPSQQASHPSFMDRLWSQYKEIVAAVCFLSILPLPGNAQNILGSKEAETQPQLVLGSAYFPLVGLVIALIACLLLVIGLALHFSSLVLAALLTVALIVLTGGLHLDGLMDSCDGLFASKRRERQLEIMRDSHVGAFGVLGGICIVLLKFAIFASLDPRHLALALVIVLPLARWAMVLAISLFPSARPAGLGASAHQTITRPHIFIAATISLLIALIAGQLIGLVVWIAGSLVALIMGIWFTYTLNGLTGDLYGAIAETTEVACFLVLVALH